MTLEHRIYRNAPRWFRCSIHARMLFVRFGQHQFVLRGSR